MMQDRERLDAVLDQMMKLQQENNELKIYTEILENLLGVIHLDKLD